MSKIILASKSKARQDMLRNAGISFDTKPAELNEEKIISDMVKNEASSGNIALTLAKEKALYISKKKPEYYIIGSDQVLSMEDKIYSKAKDKKEAVNRLQQFQGKEHFLTSAVCVAKGENIIWHKTDVAALKMKPLTSQDIEKYSEIAGNDLTQCVGCYALEGVGIRLFHNIRGDFFTILGMPLLPLLTFLEKEGALL